MHRKRDRNPSESLPILKSSVTFDDRRHACRTHLSRRADRDRWQVPVCCTKSSENCSNERVSISVTNLEVQSSIFHHVMSTIRMISIDSVDEIVDLHVLLEFNLSAPANANRRRRQRVSLPVENVPRRTEHRETSAGHRYWPTSPTCQ